MQSPPTLNLQQLTTAFDNWTRHPITEMLMQWIDERETELYHKARNVRRSDPERALDHLTETRAFVELKQAIKDKSFLPTLTNQ